MARRLVVKRSELVNANHRYLRAFRLRLEVVEAINMPSEVFLYQRGLPDEHTGNTIDTLITVCSPVDLADYPVGAPDPSAELPYFRQSTVELDVRSSEEYMAIWHALREAMGVLCASLDRLDQLVTVETVTYESTAGDLPVSDTISESV